MSNKVNKTIEVLTDFEADGDFDSRFANGSLLMKIKN